MSPGRYQRPLNSQAPTHSNLGSAFTMTRIVDFVVKDWREARQARAVTESSEDLPQKEDDDSPNQSSEDNGEE
jgi:hypothetical protein